MPKQSPVEFTQGTMLPPEAVEFTIRIGVVGASSHAQWQVETRNATDGALLAMYSRPHFEIAMLEAELLAMMARVRAEWSTHVLPF